MTLPMSSEILLLNARFAEPLFRPLRDVSVRYFTQADWVARMDLKMPF